MVNAVLSHISEAPCLGTLWDSGAHPFVGGVSIFFNHLTCENYYGYRKDRN